MGSRRQRSPADRLQEQGVPLDAKIIQLRPKSAVEPASPIAAKAAKKGRRLTFGTVTRQRSGRYQARYTSPVDRTRVTAPRTFDDRATAVAWLEKERPLTEDPATWVAPKERLAARLAAREIFGEYATRWLAQRANLTARTRADYGRLLRLLAPTFDQVPVHQITRAHVKAWYATFCVDHPNQRAKTYSLMKTIMKEAVSDGLIDRNPVDIQGASTVKRSKPTEILTLSELHALADAMPARWRTLVYLSTFTAIRMGEAFELRRRDVDLDVGVPVIRVTRAVSRINEGGHVRREVGGPKSLAGVRTLELHGGLVSMLRDHLAHHVGPSEDALVFASATGGHLSPSTLYGRAPSGSYPGRGFYAARAAIGKPHFNWHSLRHTGGVFYSHTDSTLAEIMGWMGHSTIAMAMHYQHVADGRQRHNVRQLTEQFAIPALDQAEHPHVVAEVTAAGRDGRGVRVSVAPALDADRQAGR